MPDMPDIQGVMVEKQGSDHPLLLIYGKRKVGAVKIHKFSTDAPGGAENEFLHLIAVFCEGPVHAIEEVFFNGISENDAQWNKDGGGKWFTISRHLGAHDQPASAAAVSGIPNWTINHRLQGVAYVYIRVQMDEQQSIWRGEPEIVARVAGRTIHDPRTGQTAYSENPAIQLLDYLLNPVYGKGMPVGRLNIASFIAAANLCDQTVDNTAIINGVVTGQVAKRFTGNQVIDTSRSVFANVHQMLQGMRGMLPIGTGQIRSQLEGEGEPVFFFSHDRSDGLNHATIVGPIKSSSGKKNGRYNRVIVRFANKDADYEQDEVFWPANDHPLAQQWLDEDNGVRLEQSFEFPGITNKAEALQMAEIIAKRSRNQLSCSFPASPLAILCEPGDIVGITDDTRGWDAKPFRVEQTKHNEDGSVELDFVEHQNAVYPWSGTSYEQRIGGTNLGDPTNIPAPSGLTLTPDQTLQTGGRLTWSSPANAFVRRYQVNVLSGTTLLFSEETVARTITLPLLDVGEYSITVRAISSLGTYSPAAALAFTMVLPVPPSDIVLEATHDTIGATAQLAGRGFSTVFNYDCVEGDGAGHTPSPRTTGSTAVFVGLKPNTLHTVFAQTVNVLGESGWINRQIETNDYSVLVDMLEEEMADAVFPRVVTELQETVLNAFPTAAEVDALMEAAIGDPRVDYNRTLLTVIDEYEFHATVEGLQFAIATEAETRAAQILTLNANDAALAQQIMTVSDKADGTAESLAAIRTAIQGDDTGTSAELILQSWRNELGEMNSRAFLGVTSVTAGVARVNGVLIDGETNTIEFQTGAMRWIGLDGVPQLYWSAVRNRIVFSGEIDAAVYNAVKDGWRLRIDPASEIILWFGPSSVPAHEQTRSNGRWWLDNSGQYKGNANVGRQSYPISLQGTETQTRNITMPCISGFADMHVLTDQVFGQLSASTVINNTHETIYLSINLYADGVFIGQYVHNLAVIYIGALNPPMYEVMDNGSRQSLIEYVDNTAKTYGSNVNYEARVSIHSRDPAVNLSSSSMNLRLRIFITEVANTY
ncbi:phage tail protein [Alkalimonas sp. NCh-2]|uniref:phage tail protein n=1 Tax=Alkalimonas sp. NCh-2 TaxID=3144846 RepID=UPI0031F6D0FF